MRPSIGEFAEMISMSQGFRIDSLLWETNQEKRGGYDDTFNRASAPGAIRHGAC